MEFNVRTQVLDKSVNEFVGRKYTKINKLGFNDMSLWHLGPIISILRIQVYKHYGGYKCQIKLNIF